MMRLIAKFRRDEAGAITVDWVILSAGVIALAIGVVRATADDRAALQVDLTGSNGEANEIGNRVEREFRHDAAAVIIHRLRTDSE